MTSACACVTNSLYSGQLLTDRHNSGQLLCHFITTVIPAQAADRNTRSCTAYWNKQAPPPLRPTLTQQRSDTHLSHLAWFARLPLVPTGCSHNWTFAAESCLPAHFSHCIRIIFMICGVYSYPTSCMRGQWARLAATAHNFDVPTEVRLKKKHKHFICHETCSSIGAVTPKRPGRVRESYWILVSFFRNFIALDRLTDPSYPIWFSERLPETRIRNTKLRTKSNKCNACDACVTYSSTVMCVSDGRTRAILAAVTSPRLLLDTLANSTNRRFNSVLK